MLQKKVDSKGLEPLLSESKSDVLEVSTDTLVYGSSEEKAKSKITDSELLSMFSKAQNLDPEDVQCIKSMLGAFIFQKDMQRQLAK